TSSAAFATTQSGPSSKNVRSRTRRVPLAFAVIASCGPDPSPTTISCQPIAPFRQMESLRFAKIRRLDNSQDPCSLRSSSIAWRRATIEPDTVAAGCICLGGRSPAETVPLLVGVKHKNDDECLQGNHERQADDHQHRPKPQAAAHLADQST